MELRYHVSVEYSNNQEEPTFVERGLGSYFHSKNRKNKLKSLATKMAEENPGQNLRLIPYPFDESTTRLRII